MISGAGHPASSELTVATPLFELVHRSGSSTPSGNTRSALSGKDSPGASVLASTLMAALAALGGGVGVAGGSASANAAHANIKNASAVSARLRIQEFFNTLSPR